MELRHLAKLTGLPFRTIRYVVEHEIVPRSKVAIRGRGSVRPRLFGDETGILIACAASLLEGGIKRALVEKVVQCLQELERPVSRRKTELVFDAIALDVFDARIEVGDNRVVRIITGPPCDWESGWLDLESLEKVTETRQPTVIVQLDVGRIRDLVLSEDTGDGADG